MIFIKKIKNRLKQRYIKEQFHPSLFGSLLNPYFISRKNLLHNIEELVKNLNGRFLDVGCGTKPYKDICDYTEYIGLEIDDGKTNVNADFFYDGSVFPFENNVFDVVLTNQVFEHVFNPDKFIKEIRRVLYKDGFLLMTVPFVWDEHEQPYDFGRYTSYGIQHIVKENGFDIIEIRKSSIGFEAIFQLFSNYLYKLFATKYMFFNILLISFLVFPINIIGIVLTKLLPFNDDIYLDNIILAKKREQ